MNFIKRLIKILSKLRNNIFTGDTLFIEGCGICTEAGGDASELFQSLQYLKEIVAQDDYIYPGHAFFAAVGQPANCLTKNIYMCIEDIDDFVFLRMRKNQTLSYSFV